MWKILQNYASCLRRERLICFAKSCLFSSKEFGFFSPLRKVNAQKTQSTGRSELKNKQNIILIS